MESFDYIVIGAGSAGCVIASRLSEMRDARVLILEAGGSDSSVLFRKPGMLALVYEIPALKEKTDWGYRTTPQPHMDNRQMPWTRGKLVGGCSSVNGMLYLRGNRANYDEWASWGNEGWSYNDVLPYFKKSECHEDGESEFHGSSGPMLVSRQTGISVISEALQESIANVCNVPVLSDFNGAQQEGASTFQMTCGNRLRSSTAVAFLHPALDRPNLHVVSEALVTRIMIEKGRACGVTYVKDGKKHIAYADAEVILSAGAINSPQILMLSGIGPADHLKSVGISPIHDLQGVGLNLHDHVLVPLRYLATRDTGHRSTPSHFFAGMFQEFVLQRGWMGKTFLEGGAFVKSDPSRPIPDLQFHSIPWAYPEPNDDGPEKPTISSKYSFTIMPGIIYPESRGEIRLATDHPADAPLINPNYYKEDIDMQSMIKGIEITREVAKTEPLSRYMRGEATPGLDTCSDADLRAFVRLYTKTIYHPVGTCKMGVDPLAVVNPALKVCGIEGLRVADASIMPKITGGNTNAPSIMIGEKASDLIKQDASGRLGATGTVLYERGSWLPESQWVQEQAHGDFRYTAKNICSDIATSAPIAFLEFPLYTTGYHGNWC
jgi:choline dehydrogenase